MFCQIGVELLGLVRIQFIISVALFLIFILFIMYGGMVFLYYYNDLLGAILTSATFLVTAKNLATESI